MPVRVYYIASAKGDYMTTAPCKLWEPGEVKTIFNKGAGLMNRLFNIKLELVSPLIKIDAPDVGKVYYKAVGAFNQQHRQFNRIAGLAGGGVRFSKREIHILFLGQIYDDKKFIASAKGIALSLTEATRDYNHGGHKVIMGYIHRSQLKSSRERKNNCSVTGGMKVDLITQSAVLAHELGHCLHLRHIQDEPADRLGNIKNLSNNIMDENMEPVKPGKKGPASPGLHEYRVLEFQYRSARRYGR
ncbi:MAG: hypothetical protein GY940_44760, partial [bacterium]|nr:hypothetical protein [bacterium]